MLLIKFPEYFENLFISRASMYKDGQTQIKTCKGSFKKYVRWEEGGGHWKANKNEQGGGGGPTMCVRSLFLKQMLIFSKLSFMVIFQFFLLIILAVWNIKQTIMKNYNIQSCQWMACYRFRPPFLLCTTFWSFLRTVHCFLCAFSAKMATYSLVIDNVYLVISS